MERWRWEATLSTITLTPYSGALSRRLLLLLMAMVLFGPVAVVVEEKGIAAAGKLSTRC